MKKSSIIFSLLATILLLSGLFGYSNTAEAEEHHKVYLHKQVTKSKKSEREMLTEKQGINGAEFTVIDITHFVRTHSNSIEEALEQVKAVTKTDVANLEVGQEVPNRLGMNVVAKGETAQLEVMNKHGKTETVDGVLALTLAKKNKSHDASYLLIETNSVSHANASDSIILHFPIENEQDTVMPDGSIHIYTKNDSFIEPLIDPTIEKHLAEDHADFSYDEAINYEIEVKIPSLIGVYTYFKVIDIPDAALLTNNQTVKVTDEKGKEIDSSSYKVSAKDNGFVIDFQPAKLVPYRETTLKISYQLTIKPGAEADKPFYNKALLQYNDSTKDQEKSTDAEEVTTGGYRFVKVDKNNHELKLKAASFVVKNQAGNYLTTNYTWKESKQPATDKELLTLVSNQEGVFEIKGLAYGDYQIEEIVAPKGYRLLQQPINFKIEKNTYESGKSTGILEVVNSKLPEKKPDKDGSDQLPRTGDTNLNLGVSGGLLILLALIIYSFNKKMQQKEMENWRK